MYLIVGLGIFRRQNKMYLIVGLGNPEPEYSMTRHNMGFDVVNMFAKKNNIEINKKGFDGIYGMGNIEGKKVLILKPQTYMNESGKSIIQIKNYYKISDENTLVIYDDIDLPEGTVKIRKKGGPGTHNGMRSVVRELNSTNFPRIRVGTGSPEFKELLIDYVIQKLNQEQYEKLEPAIKKAENDLEDILKLGIDLAMNRNN